MEVVFALPERQELIALEVAPGTSVGDAIDASGIAARFPDESLAGLPTGIWGREAAHDTVLRNGDRVEIYRPLAMEPKEARRQLAMAGRTMADERRDPENGA